jgi:hypothetical protein
MLTQAFQEKNFDRTVSSCFVQKQRKKENIFCILCNSYLSDSETTLDITRWLSTILVKPDHWQKNFVNGDDGDTFFSFAF